MMNERAYWFKKFDIDSFNQPYPLKHCPGDGMTENEIKPVFTQEMLQDNLKIFTQASNRAISAVQDMAKIIAATELETPAYGQRELLAKAKGGITRASLTRFYQFLTDLFFGLYMKASKANTESWMKQWGGN